jgi:hypothetical protein
MKKKPDYKLIDAFLTDTRGYDESSELTQLKAENERLKNQLKLFVDAMNAMADTTFIINH